MSLKANEMNGCTSPRDPTIIMVMRSFLSKLIGTPRKGKRGRMVRRRRRRKKEEKKGEEG